MFEKYPLIKKQLKKIKQKSRFFSDQLYLKRCRKPLVKTVPDFLIIGAMRSGTTSLHDHLKQHPEIFMTFIKEPGIFMENSPIFQVRSYLKSKEQLTRMMFKGHQGEKCVGESSTYYTEAPTLGEEVPGNIRRLAPQMKFVYLVRNPFHRILSHYLFMLQLNVYSESLNQVLAKDTTFLERSLYFYQLERYLALFPKEQFKIILFEEFIQNPSNTLNELSEFLEVNPTLNAHIPLKQKNPSLLKNKTSKEGCLFSNEMYEKLYPSIQADVNQLEQFLNRSLALWDLSKVRWCE